MNRKKEVIDIKKTKIVAVKLLSELKFTEEAGELAEGIAKDRPVKIEDSIGNVVVVLTVLSLRLGLDIEECIRIAYNEIKNRK